MNATIKTLLLAAAVLGFSTASHASAVEGQMQLRLSPSPGYPSAPRLGIYGHHQWGLGMVVDSVVRGTPASRVGLEPGDVIRAINGRPIRAEWDYFQALRDSGGYVRLTVQDVRSGAIVARTAYLGGEYYGSGSVAGVVIGPR